ncbi:MAG: ElaA protein [Arenicella sp.]|jgi:ElaA protein
MKLTWKTDSFETLATRQLYDLLMLRQAVFVVEQECAYPDLDDTDLLAMHLSGHSDSGELMAYARLIRPGVSYDQASIGRVVVSPNARGRRLGQSLMEAALAEMARLYPGQAIKIGAQQHLEKFYNELGFETISKMYLEDGIPHIHMLRQ